MRPLVLAIALFLTPGASAQPVDFARKTINVYIGYTPGGSYDLYGRIMARHLGRHLPGQPTVVPQNMPGAGSLKASNYVYDVAPKDGTALGVVAETLAMEQALSNPGVQYDARKFTWIGRIASSNNIHVMWHTSKVQSIEDAKRVEATVAGTGPGNILEIVPKLLNAVIGTKFKIVSGYPASNEALLAMERGEVDGAGGSWAAIKVGRQEWLQQKKIKIILQDLPERSADLPDVPCLVELGRTEEEKQLLGLYASGGAIGRSLIGPPGIPADVVKTLRDGFNAMAQDPELVAEINKLNIELAPLTGDEVQKAAENILSVPESVKQRAKALFGR